MPILWNGRAPRAGARVLLALAAAVAAGNGRAGDGDGDGEIPAGLASPPLGLPETPFPPRNPPTAGKIALGRKLFFDRRLSRGGTQSCATCHAPEQAFTQNGRETSEGAGGQPLRRNAPGLLNVAHTQRLQHDGEAPSLETQILGPLFDPFEMGNATFGDLLGRIRGLPDYRGLFERTFGAPATIETVGQAIASYERSLLSANAPFDRWRYGKDEATLGPEAKTGFALFSGKARCATCHLIGERTALFTDQDFHDTGIGWRRDAARRRGAQDPGIASAAAPAARVGPAFGRARQDDRGRIEVTADPRDLYKYRTPGLRNAAVTAPYMHDGSIATLGGVVRYYNEGGAADPNLDPAIRPLGLTGEEIAALVAFLESLTGDGARTFHEPSGAEP